MDDTLTRYAIKMALVCAAVVLVGAWWALARVGRSGGAPAARPRASRALDVGLAVLALLSVAAYFEFGWLRYDRYMNPHDVYHYYVGAKYSAEHRYFDLYRASLVADREIGGRGFSAESIRNLDVVGKFEPVDEVLARRDEIKARFSPERWEEFKGDIAFFRSTVPVSKWNRMLTDKGYNATPVWNAVARFLAEASPTSSIWAMRALTMIDLALLVGMFAAVWWAFGARATMMTVVFLGTTFIMSHVHIKGAFMRLDWVCALVVATCCLKKGRYKTAGALCAYAGLARIFPFIFCFGLGVKALLDVVGWARARRAGAPRPLHRGYLGFFVGFSVVLFALVGATLLPDGGLESWRDFLSKITQHDRELSTTRVGFKYVFLEPWPSFRQKLVAFDQYRVLFLGICGLALLAAAFAVRKAEDYEALPLSYVAAFFLAAPTFYYQVMLLVPLLLFVPKVHLPSRALGLVLMLAFSLVAYGLSWEMKHGSAFFLVVSWMLLGLCAAMIVAVLFGPRVDEAVERRLRRAAAPA